MPMTWLFVLLIGQNMQVIEKPTQSQCMELKEEVDKQLALKIDPHSFITGCFIELGGKLKES